MVGVTPMDYIAANAALSRLLAEAIYWTNSKPFWKYETFAHENM